MAWQWEIFRPKSNMELYEDQPHTLDIAPTHYYFFPKLKGKFLGTIIEIEPLKKILDGVTSTLATDMHDNALYKLVYCHRKCILIDD